LEESTVTTDYATFLASKRKRHGELGVEVAADAIHPTLFPFQRYVVQWACRKGRAALFEDCGLGKTFQQIEWARLMLAHGPLSRPNGRALIMAPLAVNRQTVHEGERLGVPIHDLRGNWTPREGLNVVNYEHHEKIDPSDYDVVVLDESSILKNYMGKTKQALIEMWRDTPYRLACTATPAPNDHMELGNHAQFLGVMASNEMLARWFINDTMAAGNYRLKAHAAEDFWHWVCSWAVCLDRPSDLGFSDDGYERPEVRWIEHVVDSPMEDPEPGNLFAVDRLTATTLHREMRASSTSRAATAATLVALDPDAAWIVWCNTNYEADALRAAIPDSHEVRGSESSARKEERLEAFTEGRILRLITKPSIAGLGLNWQHCHNVIVAGLSYSMEQLYQAVKRTDRFGQAHAVDVHVLRSEAEGDVLATVHRKLADFERMKEAMTEAMREQQIKDRDDALRRIPASVYAETDGYRLWHGDSCEVMREIEDSSVGLSVFSPPFANLYIYSDAEQDLGNATDHSEFFEHFRFIVRELKRVTIPGRIAAVHCKDLPAYMGRDDYAGLVDFPGDCVKLFESEGWRFHSRTTIWKDPVIEMQRTKNHGLLYKQLRKDSSFSRQGMADYLLMFRRWDGVAEGEPFPQPVTHTKDSFPLDQWQEWASPVWMTVQQGRILRDYRQGKTPDDERHICPLQLDVIERAVGLWSNPGDLVFSPFAGIGSEGHQALKMGRRFLGIELKESYCAVASKNLEHAEREANAPTLFDALPVEAEA